MHVTFNRDRRVRESFTAPKYIFFTYLSGSFAHYLINNTRKIYECPNVMCKIMEDSYNTQNQHHNGRKEFVKKLSQINRKIH